MSDILGDRGKALENDYFRRKEQEALARLREKNEQERTHTSGEESSFRAALRCPRDGGEMVAVMMEDVQVDRCPACGGLWLDAGELEQLTSRDEGQGFFGRMRRTLTGE